MRIETLGPVGSTRYKEYSKDINHAGLHLLNLINDLLDLPNIEADKGELFEEIFDIHLTLKSVILMVQQRADKNDVTRKFDVADDVPYICADERKVKQVLTNLLTNAIKFTKRGGCVSTSARCHPSSGFEFKITDTGIGIAPDDIPKALSQFGQVESDLNRKYEGSGLGLPLTKAIVELHDGSLELESEVGVGTTVTVRFPAGRILSGTNAHQRSSL